MPRVEGGVGVEELALGKAAEGRELKEVSWEWGQPCQLEDLVGDRSPHRKIKAVPGGRGAEDARLAKTGKNHGRQKRICFCQALF